MSCEDCKELRRELSHLRVIVEQNFSALLKRLDHQDKNLLLMTELVSDKFHNGTSQNTVGNHGVRKENVSRKFPISIGRRNIHKRIVPPMKRPRSMLTHILHPGRNTDRSNIPEVNGESENVVEDGLESENGQDYYGNGFSATGNQSKGDGRNINGNSTLVMESTGEGFMENHDSESGEMIEEHFLNQTCEFSFQEGDHVAEGESGNDVNLLDVMAAAAAAEYVDDNEGDADFGIDTMSCEEALAVSGSPSTSGTACVTVRSAIRMEDLDQGIDGPLSNSVPSMVGGGRRTASKSVARQKPICVSASPSLVRAFRDTIVGIDFCRFMGPSLS